MIILGICHDVLTCSACIMVDGAIIAAIPEERLDRVKQSRIFPHHSIDKCLEIAEITMEDVDEIAVGWNPAADLESIPGGYLNTRRWRTEHFMQVPGQFIQSGNKHAALTTTISNLYDNCPPITFVNHYRAHIGNGYLQSPFNEAAVMVLDGRGEQLTALTANASGTVVEDIEECSFPHSLGLFYGAITQFLGHRPDSDEWKVMALASYANRDNKYYPIIKKLIDVDTRGRLSLDLTYFEFFNFWSPLMYSEKLVDALGPARIPNTPYQERDEQIASAMQQVFEETVTEMLTKLHKQTGQDNLVVTGGCFMNSVYNGKILDQTPFNQCHISFCPDDSGTSLGAAAWLYTQRTGNRPAQLTSSYLGTEFNTENIRRTIERFKLPNVQELNDPTTTAARDIADGKIIGWFQGRAEFGQRALGNRSILADPRRPEMKDAINAAVKFREGFRPFAPAILSEETANYFQCQSGTQVDFMEKVFQFQQDKIESLPAVAHVDGSGRLQTVNKDINPLFHKLISEFRAITDTPIVVNTSFNLNGEPVVDKPEDAIRTFYACGLDVLYLGNFRISK